MRPKHIEVRNFMGLETFSGDFPAICLIEGEVGQGKSSLQRAMRYCFDSGHDPELIRRNSSNAEVTLTLDDGTEVRATITPGRDGTRRMTRPAGGKKWLLGRENLDELANAISYNPLAFMTMTEEKQRETLLSVMPIPVEPGELRQAIGGVSKVREIAAGSNGLDVVQRYIGEIYGRRTDVNRDVKTLEAHAGQLEEALGPDAAEGEDWSQVARRLGQEQIAFDQAEREALSGIERDFNAAKLRLSTATIQLKDEVDADIDQKIRELEAQRAQRKGAIEDDAVRALEATRVERRRQESEIRTANAPERARLVREYATAEERARMQQKQAGTREAATQARLDATAKRAESRNLTEALDRLEELKKQVASRMKIQNIEFDVEGRICRMEGAPPALVPYRLWNTTSKIAFCLKIAVLTHGKCGFICVDSIGDLSPSAVRGLEEMCRRYAESEGIQFILGKATSGPLRISDGLGSLFEGEKPVEEPVSA